jgi:hypothetical protein
MSIIPAAVHDDVSSQAAESQQLQIRMLNHMVQQLKAQLAREQSCHERDVKQTVEEALRKAHGEHDVRMRQLHIEQGEKAQAAEREVSGLKAQIQLLLTEKSNSATEAGMKSLRAAK